MHIGTSAHRNWEKLQIFVQATVQLATQAFFKIFFKFEVIGGDKAVEEIRIAKSKSKGLIFAANHTHELDAVIVRCALPLRALSLPMYYVAMTADHYRGKKFGWRSFFYGGNFFKMLGAYPAYLGLHDYHASLINHTELLEHNRVVCIFPEGKISVDTLKPSEPKGGVGFLAVNTETDVLPVKITGLIDIPWFKVFTFQRPKVTVEYRTVLGAKELIQASRDEHVPDGVETYKNIAKLIMKVVRA